MMAGGGFPFSEVAVSTPSRSRRRSIPSSETAFSQPAAAVRACAAKVCAVEDIARLCTRIPQTTLVSGGRRSVRASAAETAGRMSRAGKRYRANFIPPYNCRERWIQSVPWIANPRYPDRSAPYSLAVGMVALDAIEHARRGGHLDRSEEHTSEL